MTIILPSPGQEPWDVTLNTALSNLDSRLATVESSGGGSGGDTTGAWYAGRQWYAVGTSLVVQGFWTNPLAAMSGMIQHNLGANGGNIANGGASGGNGLIWNQMLTIGTDAEVITMDSSNDWRNSVVLGTVDDPEDPTVSFYGAMKATCAWVLTNRPAARFFHLTNYTDAYPNTYPNFKSQNSHGKWYWEFNDAVRRVCDIYGVPVIEIAREAGINYYTAPFYTSDGLHANTLGGQRYAEYMWSRMRSLDWGTSPPTGATGGTVPVTGVTIQQGATLTLTPASTQQLTVSLVPANATNKAVTWQSSATGVATVNASGLVTGVANGSATITVTTADGGKTDTIAVTVSGTVPVSSVDMVPATVGLTIGQTQQLTATITPANATNQAVTYVSNTPSVATVSSTGLVTAVANGSAVITVTTTDGSKTDTTAVTVAAAAWTLNPQTTFRQAWLTGLTATGSNPTYTNTVGTVYGVIYLNTPGDNAVEFAVKTGSLGMAVVIGSSNADTDFVTLGGTAVPFNGFLNCAHLPAGVYTAIGPPTPVAGAANWGSNTVYRVGRIGNRVLIARVSGGVVTPIWDGDLSVNYPGGSVTPDWAKVNLGLIMYSTVETYYSLPINCKTGTWSGG